MADDDRQNTPKGSTYEQACALLSMQSTLPSLVVFDLDYTLWPFWCECLSASSNPTVYPDVPGILAALQYKGVRIAVASRTPTPDTAKAFMKKLGWSGGLFCSEQIYPSSSHKTQHFKAIRQDTGVPYSEMVFFDDEMRNISAISKLGVTAVLTESGVNLGAFGEGLAAYSASALSGRGF